MKKCLLFSAAIFAMTPTVFGETEEIPTLEVNGNHAERSVYSKIQVSAGSPGERVSEPALYVGSDSPASREVYNKIIIQAGTSGERKSEPALLVDGQTQLSRAVYNKIRIDADSYTLISVDPTKAPDIPVSFDGIHKVSVITRRYTTDAVRGTYTLQAGGASNSPVNFSVKAGAPAATSDRTYTFNTTSKVTVGTRRYTTDGENGTYTLVSNDPAKEDIPYQFDKDNPLRMNLSSKFNEVVSSVEDIPLNGSSSITYHSPSETLRACWDEAKEIIIYNLNGHMVRIGLLGGSYESMSVETLPAGVYVVTSGGENSLQTLKFIKQ